MYLVLDGYQIALVSNRVQLQLSDGSMVKAAPKFPAVDLLSQAFILEQSGKCDSKLASGDHDGAVTNARSLLEAVLFEIEGQLDAGRLDYDGEL